MEEGIKYEVLRRKLMNSPNITFEKNLQTFAVCLQKYLGNQPNWSHFQAN